MTGKLSAGNNRAAATMGKRHRITCATHGALRMITVCTDGACEGAVYAVCVRRRASHTSSVSFGRSSMPTTAYLRVCGMSSLRTEIGGDLVGRADLGSISTHLETMKSSIARRVASGTRWKQRNERAPQPLAFQTSGGACCATRANKQGQGGRGRLRGIERRSRGGRCGRRCRLTINAIIRPCIGKVLETKFS